MIHEVVKLTANPAAGNEILYTADEDMIVHSVMFTLVTSAVVANRFVALVADDGVNQYFRSADPTARAASTSNQYCFFEGASGNTLSLGFALPAQGLRLRKGDRLGTSTSAKDVGDDYTAAVAQVERPGQAGQ